MESRPSTSSMSLLCFQSLCGSLLSTGRGHSFPPKALCDHTSLFHHASDFFPFPSSALLSTRLSHMPFPPPGTCPFRLLPTTHHHLLHLVLSSLGISSDVPLQPLLIPPSSLSTLGSPWPLTFAFLFFRPIYCYPQCLAQAWLLLGPQKRRDLCNFHVVVGFQDGP